MFEKSKLNRKVKGYKKQILAIEKKRYRSQAALVEAILTHTTPSDDDVDYFNRYTAQIDAIRTELQVVEEQLKAL